MFTVEFEMPDGVEKNEQIIFGEIKRVDLSEGEEAKVSITPRKGFDLGAGPGHKLETTVIGGVVGVVLDGRGRPLQLPAETDNRKKILQNWFDSMNLYPQKDMEQERD